MSPTKFVNGTSAFQHPALDAYPHGFFTCKGGTSSGIYSSLNAGFGSQDDPQHVAENRSRAAGALGMKPAQICGLYQTHSAEVITYSSDHPHPDKEQRPKADGLVTNQTGLALAIVSADCAPIFFADKQVGKQVGIIGACHAGWRGAAAGIIQNTVLAMAQLGASLGDIIMVIGPTIAKQSYQIEDAMRSEALNACANLDKAEDCFTRDPSAPDRWLFDLPAFCHLAGKQAGVGHIYNLGIDTYQNADENVGFCFSHRRATHNNQPDSGRLLSLIALPILNPS